MIDETLAKRIRTLLAGHEGLTEKRMFGGLAFMLRGNMCAGVVKEDLMVRVGPAACAELASRPHARPMDFTGKPLKGFLFVAPPGTASDLELRSWLDRAVAFAASLPHK
jgi:TfoX/Sxy family transcriptional regulator of competence genes